MKASELRIGNFVNLEGHDSKLNSTTFKAIIDGRCEVIEPIPLTEEWLVKFWFRKQGGVFVINLREDLILRCSFSKSGLSSVIDEFDFMGDRETVSLNQIKYVHQMQNLYFALTGQELTITIKEQ